MEWGPAAERADGIATSWERHTARTWDGRAIRGVLAVVLAGLAVRQRRHVGEVKIGSLLWHLDQGPSMVYELGAAAGLGTEAPLPEAAAEEWAWLNRRWSPDFFGGDNSGGLPRGIGRGSPLPAVEVVTGWAADAAQKALVAERPRGYCEGMPVQVVSGAYEGRLGKVVAVAWRMDDEHRTVFPGPPPGYEVELTAPGRKPQPWLVVIPTLDGEVVAAAPGPRGARVIIPAHDLNRLEG